MNRYMKRIFMFWTLIICMTNPVPAETVALWLFDDPAGATTALDSSGNGFHLTLGTAGGIQSTGRYGNCLTNTVGQVANIGGKVAQLMEIDDTLIDTTLADSFTIEGWFRANPLPQGDLWSTLFRVGRTTDNWTVDTTALYYRDYGGFTVAIDRSGPGSTQAAPFVAGVWTHLAVTHDDASHQVNFFKDGQIIHSYAASPPPDGFETAGAPALHLLSDPTDQRDTFAFPGSVDELRFSNQALYTGNFIPPSSLAGPVPPTIYAWPQELTFIVDTEGIPDAQTLTLRSNAMPMNWSISENLGWLSVEPSSGQISDGPVDVSISVDPTGLNTGQYHGTLSVQAPGADNAPVVVNVGLTVVSAVRSIGNRKQLFIDERFIDASENITLRMNPAERLGIALDTQQSPWEDLPYGYARVIQDEGIIKMYYNGSFGGTLGLAYAESTDGIHFTRPPLGLVELNGHDTNIIYRDGTTPDGMIFLDPHDIPARRYKLFNSVYGEGVYASYSADGIHFTNAGVVFPMHGETGSIAFWDERIDRYVVYTRILNVPYEAAHHLEWYDTVGLMDGSVAPVGHEHCRAAGRIETDDLLAPWPYNTGAAQANQPTKFHLPMVLTADEKDDPHLDFYVNSATFYPYAEDVYLMFPTAFRHFDVSRQTWFAGQPVDTNGPRDIQLAVSRDGINWQRPDRRPYIDFGLGDEWDRWAAQSHPGIVRVGKYLYQYHYSGGGLHSLYIWRPEYEGAVEMRPAINVARQRLDGFMSADSDYTGGWITTPPVIFTGNELRLNLDAGAAGSLFVEIRDVDNQPIPGYTLAACEEAGGNFVDMLVRWNGSTDVSALAGTPVRLHFQMRATKLYAFQFADDNARNNASDWEDFD